MENLASGSWTGTLINSYQYTAIDLLEIVVQNTNITGNISVTLASGNTTYSLPISGTVIGNRINFITSPPGSGSLNGYWTELWEDLIWNDAAYCSAYLIHNGVKVDSLRY